MKKIILTLGAISLLALFSCSKQKEELQNFTSDNGLEPLQTTVNSSQVVNCGNALSSMLLSFSNMSESAVNRMDAILDMNISDGSKSTLLSSDPLLSTTVSNVMAQNQILTNNNFDLVMQDINNKSLFTKTVSNNLGYPDLGGIQFAGGPCSPWKYQQETCIWAMADCMMFAGVGCLAATVGYLACFWGASAICAGIGMLCQAANDSNYPGCVPTGIVYKPNPFLMSWAQTAQSGGSGGTN